MDWKDNKVLNWDNTALDERDADDIISDTLYCKYCKKLFQSVNTHENHLDGKKHLKNVKAYEK